MTLYFLEREAGRQPITKEQFDNLIKAKKGFATVNTDALKVAKIGQEGKVPYGRGMPEPTYKYGGRGRGNKVGLNGYGGA